jgi:hypothetical protein
MNKGCIYYTDNRLAEPIFSIVQGCIKASKLPITSVSLSPINFGGNYVLSLPRGYITMIKQIAHALTESKCKYVFFCEHDVLYPLSHFEFTPEKDDLFYYNANVWRWKYPEELAITYDRLISLSGLCVNRKFALAHYNARLKKIKELKLDQVKGHDPLWARRWGYEPGTKKIKRGGFSDDDFETWMSAEPIVDIRHRRTFSPTKVTLESFKHLPTGWKETTIDKIPGWNLREIFDLDHAL